jgi:hypothetical protein
MNDAMAPAARAPRTIERGPKRVAGQGGRAPRRVAHEIRCLPAGFRFFCLEARVRSRSPHASRPGGAGRSDSGGERTWRRRRRRLVAAASGR